MPRRSVPLSLTYNREWFAWGPGPGAEWAEGVPPPLSFWEIVKHAAHLAWQPLWLQDPAYRGGNVRVAHSVWWAIGLWHFGIVLVVRTLWNRWSIWGCVRDLRGHVFQLGRSAFEAAVLAGLAASFLLGLWRLERGLWEASIMYGSPAGRWTTMTIDQGVKAIMLLQIILIHWLIVWYTYRWSLRRGVGRGEVVMRATDRCPTCGYETAGGRCPECGADRNDVKSVRPRVWIPWIENRAWVRWVFRTPTALGVIVVLFFSPVWVPAIRMGVRALFP